MADKLLLVFNDLLYKVKANTRAWFMVENAIIVGTWVTHPVFLETLFRAVTFSGRKEDGTEHTFQYPEGEMEIGSQEAYETWRDEEEKEGEPLPWENLRLTDVRMLMGGESLELGPMSLRIDKITAWGLGDPGI